MRARPHLSLLGAAALHCAGSSPSRAPSPDGGGCYPDSDGYSGVPSTIVLSVDDTGFSRTVINTENNASVTLTLTNTGTTPHGLSVGCVSVVSAYPDLPAVCPATACFPAGATIAPLAPGASATVMFLTPLPDNLIYPFTSNEPSDAAVPGLTSGQWSLM